MKVSRTSIAVSLSRALALARVARLARAEEGAATGTKSSPLFSRTPNSCPTAATEKHFDACLIFDGKKAVTIEVRAKNRRVELVKQ